MSHRLARGLRFGAAGLWLALAAPAVAASYGIVYSFQGGDDGRLPASAPAADSTGRLYIETLGGTRDFGAVFRLTPPATAGAPWTEADLYDFADSNLSLLCGTGQLLIDAGGSIYGTGRQHCGDVGEEGLVYRLTPAGSAYQMTDLLASTGLTPSSGVQFGADGLLYTGAYPSAGTAGLLLRTHPQPGATQTGPVLAGVPSALSLPSQGRFFFTTATGGFFALGTVQMLTTQPGGTVSLSVIYSFQGGSDANTPRFGAPAVGSDHAVYGCGSGGANGLGAIFRLVPPAAGQSAWTESVIYSFSTAQTVSPALCTVTAAPNGGLVGTLEVNAGAVFALQPPAVSGGAWSYTLLHSFVPRRNDLAGPEGSLVRVGNSYFGSAYSGGATNNGGVYEVTP